MKITIDLEDFWMEENDQNLTEQIKQHIVYKTKCEVWDNIKNHVMETAGNMVKHTIEAELQLAIQDNIKQFMTNDKLKKRYSSNEEITMHEWIKEEISRASVDNGKLKTFVADSAKEFTIEMKNRYDLLFASQIVAKMNDNGLLKEDAAKLLIDKK